MNIWKKQTLALLLTLLTGFTAVFSTTQIVKAQKASTSQDAFWNYDNELTETQGAFTYYAFTSQDEKEAWIYEIEVDQSQNYTTLSIPEILGGKRVTCIGYTEQKDEDRDDNYYKNIIGRTVEPYHNSCGNVPYLEKVSKIALPESLTVIQPGTFSGFSGLKSIQYPSQVSSLEAYVFYGCKRLKTITLPQGLAVWDSMAIVDCPKLQELIVPADNKAFQLKDGCVITKKGKRLVCTYSRVKTLKIPNGVKTIQKYALSNAVSKVIEIPASVVKIEAQAFEREYGIQNTKINNVTVSRKNKIYAKDGQCIYQKKDQSLTVGIPNKKGVLNVSNKIKNINNAYSLVNCNISEKMLEKVVLPKQLKTVTAQGFSPLTHAKQIYFSGTKPPTVKKVVKGSTPLPCLGTIYVPSASYEKYKSWYKKYNCWKKVTMMQY